MTDKETEKRRELPPTCRNCRSLHKKYDTILCKARQLAYFKRELLRALPLVGRLAAPWECDLRDEVDA